MILGAFGVIDASPIQVSEALRKLNMSHTFVGGFGRTTHATVDGLCAEQPVWPVIIDRVRNIPKVAIPYDRVVYFVCDARSQLAMSNLSQQLWPDTRVLDLHLAIGVAMVDATQNPGEPWELKVNEPTLDEYVRQAAQPSFMNFLQARVVAEVAHLSAGRELNAHQRGVARWKREACLGACERGLRYCDKRDDLTFSRHDRNNGLRRWFI
jgi:hypothetical protein